MASKKNRYVSRTQKYFRFLLFLLFLAVWAFVFLKVSVFLFDRDISQKQQYLVEQEKQLSAYEWATDYDKFLLVSDLENKVLDMPWFEHIPKILEMFKDLKDLDPASSDVIILSDFNVSLDEIKLKGSVSNLKVLYYNSPTWNFRSLLDRFKELDFIEDINIRTYEKVWWRNFEFVLTAKVIDDGK